jgi:hypothetical protein
MNRVVRVLAVCVAAAFSVTCADQATSSRGAKYARIPLAPSFAQAPAGGPSIVVVHIQGVLRGSTDSSVADAQVEGDSAILEFENVVVHGDSQPFSLGLRAYDANNVLVFDGDSTIQVKPGENAAATPSLNYVAPDAIATSIDISLTALALDWAGADTTNHSCISRAQTTPRVTIDTLSVTGKDANNVTVNGIRVGWTSRDTTAFTVDSLGVVRSKCAAKSAYLVARTFTDVADSILVTVTAPPFTLQMSPDSATVRRGSTQLLAAQVVDELGNQLPAALVTFASSDTSRATVTNGGLVTAKKIGRVLITATSGGRTTVGVIQVDRPLANSVVIQPAAAEQIGIGQTKAFFAKALDATGKIIPEASGFVFSTNAAGSVLTVNSSTGVVNAVGVGNAFIKVMIDTKRDSVSLEVLTAMPGGGIKGRVTNAADGLPLQNAVVQSSAGNSTNTLADGSFTLNNLQHGDDITVTLAGYEPITAYYMPVFPNKVIEVPAVPMSATGANSAFTGTVINALTGNVVAGVMVKAYTGVNGGPTPKRPNVPAIDSTTTDAGGNFTFGNRPVGVYTLLLKATGYSDAIAGANAVPGVTKVVPDILMPPAAVSGGLYILVTWGQCGATNVPCDLDAHLTGPKIAPDTVPPRFQVFSGNLRYIAGSDTVAALDLADASGPGPEIISIRPAAPIGVYRFYVHNATAGTTANFALSDSASARVDVYQDNHLIGTFFPPSGASGTVWNVFDYDGARLIPVGTITNPANPAVLALRAWDLPPDIGPAALKVRPLPLGAGLVAGQR